MWARMAVIDVFCSVLQVSHDSLIVVEKSWNMVKKWFGLYKVGKKGRNGFVRRVEVELEQTTLAAEPDRAIAFGCTFVPARLCCQSILRGSYQYVVRLASFSSGLGERLDCGWWHARRWDPEVRR